MAETLNVPLFPLHTVLFPGQPLPLHIFEPRYLHMVRRCIARKSPFGAILIQEGTEVGGTAIPYSVGTTVRIVRHRVMPDNRMYIVTMGESRFRVLELNRERPYLQARIELWPWDEEPEPADQLVAGVTRWLRRYLLALVDVLPDILERPSIPATPTALGILSAILLQATPEEKQRLLEAPTMTDLLLEAFHMLQLHTLVAERTSAMQPVGPEEFERISWN